MNLHPITSLFPPMSSEDYAALVADIKANGQREPIWLYRGEVIDGSHRLAACKELGITVRHQEWDGKGSLTAFVISMNLRRRHLNAGQKAMIAAESLPMFEAEAKERMRSGGGSKAGGGKITTPEPRKARDEAAAAVGVSPRYVQDAKRVKREAPDLAPKVRSGEITLGAALATVEPALRARRAAAVKHPHLKRFPKKPRGDQFERTVSAIEAHIGTLEEIYEDAAADSRRPDWVERLAAIRRMLATVSHHLERKIA